ncbi:hypothetical protein MKX03_017919 [Papaver bracteatum]|nr:hypothetical protein MKX03_017919 [Papaver bracteatum]
MRELRQGVRRGRSATKEAIEEVQRSLVDESMVIRKKRSNKNNKQQQPVPEVEQQQQQDDNNNVGGTKLYLRGLKLVRKKTVLDKKEDREPEISCFDEIREIGRNVVEMGDYHDAEENLETDDAPAAEENLEIDDAPVAEELEEEAYTTPTPYEEPAHFRTRLKLHTRSAIAQMALRINDEMSAKKQYLEEGPLRQTLVHESSNSYEMDDGTHEGSLECELTNHNYEMYNQEHEGSVPVDIPECETAKDIVVDSNNSKQKKENKLAPTSKALVAEDEMCTETRLLGKRKASGTFAEQPTVEDHLIEAPEEFESESSMRRKFHGATTLVPHIFNTNISHRNVIEYNEHGQPIGPFSSELASYMGVLARQMVPIVHENWKVVPSTLKDELWRCLEAKYVLEASSRKLLVNGIGDRWRVFKSTLTRTYILPFKDEPDCLIHPPPKYGFIKQEHWDEFVKSRLNDAFQAVHEAQSERRAKNIHPHRLGRTSYAGLIEKLKKSEGVTPEEIDRCVLWKKARQNKNGEYEDDATREQAEIIDELKKQVDDGSLVCDGNIDVLSLALRTPVGGAEKFESQPTSYQKPKCQATKVADKLHEQRKLNENKCQEERVSRSRVEDQLLNTQKMVSQLEEMLANFMQKGKSPTSISNKLPLINCGNSGKELASASAMLPANNNKDLEVEPASTSTRVPVNNNGNLGKRVALASNRVPIYNKENSGKGTALTSTRVPVSNKKNLGKGPASTSTRVHLKNNENLGNSPASSSDQANSNTYEPLTSGRSQSRVWRNDEENLPVVQVTPSTHVSRSVKTSGRSQPSVWRNDEENLPVVQVTQSRHVAKSMKDSTVSPFQRFYKSVSQKLTGSIPFISVPVDAAVFGTEMELYLDLDDVRYICHLEDLSENCVMAYIRNLYDILTERGIQHKYEFIDPASVSSAKDADLSKIITSRLMNTNCEWVFIPVKPEGAHWLLIAINMVAMSCYWLDPSGLPARYNIKPFVTFGLKGLQKDGVRRSSPIWYNIKCPKQKNSVECGFYIMKFMREIIDEPKMFTKSEPFLKSTYEQDEIDEVRLEWIRTVEAYV